MGGLFQWGRLLEVLWEACSDGINCWRYCGRPVPMRKTIGGAVGGMLRQREQSTCQCIEKKIRLFSL